MGCSEGIPDPWLVNTSFTCSAAYTISQDDIDSGSVSGKARYEAMRRSVDRVDGIVFYVLYAVDGVDCFCCSPLG